MIRKKIQHAFHFESCGIEGEEMKQYKQKEYGGKWDNKHGYRYQYKKKKQPKYQQTTYPWKNKQKSIRST